MVLRALRNLQHRGGRAAGVRRGQPAPEAYRQVIYTKQRSLDSPAVTDASLPDVIGMESPTYHLVPFLPIQTCGMSDAALKVT